ncbi:hypothetical protein CDD81_6630 [Ophiocordyceps australis]|uniref:Uncharacterized protein n=1 Tax=Ophiocordyceps australis TaxID=1399860 RepID=A0A2C5Y5X9_9HYPO|nr:hypothetical protein CDD81_6630 [Ophiocordyceps australis]
MTSLLRSHFDIRLERIELFLGHTKSIHRFPCALFTRMHPNQVEPDWLQVVGFMSLFEYGKVIFPWCLTIERPNKASRRNLAWTKFKAWALQFDPAESLERYITMALVAIAQRQLTNHICLQKHPEPDFVEPRLLLYQSMDETFLHLYKARLSTETLRLFAKPWSNMEAFKQVTWPTIEHQKIAYQPYDGLYWRLMGHLLPEEGVWTERTRKKWQRGSIRNLFKQLA